MSKGGGWTLLGHHDWQWRTLGEILGSGRGDQVATMRTSFVARNRLL